MIEILKKDWNYILYKTEEKLIISVLCGSSANYLVNLELNKSEVNLYKENGLVFINQLAEIIRERPTMFKNRNKELSSFDKSI